MEQKKTISELYQECKQKQEMEQQLDYLRETTELFKKQLTEDLFCVPVRFGPPPIPPIPQSFRGKV